MRIFLGAFGDAGHAFPMLALGKALGRPAVVPVPGITVDLMYGREFGKVLRGGQRVMPRRALDLGYEFKHPDLDEALNDLF